MAMKFEIQNSTAEFLIFQIEGKEDSVIYFHFGNRSINRIL